MNIAVVNVNKHLQINMEFVNVNLINFYKIKLNVLIVHKIVLSVNLVIYVYNVIICIILITDSVPKVG
jgi:hypothetical protein